MDHARSHSNSFLGTFSTALGGPVDVLGVVDGGVPPAAHGRAGRGGVAATSLALAVVGSDPAVLIRLNADLVGLDDPAGHHRPVSSSGDLDLYPGTDALARYALARYTVTRVEPR